MRAGDALSSKYSKSIALNVAESVILLSENKILKELNAGSIESCP
jgi:hypothetical protein